MADVDYVLRDGDGSNMARLGWRCVEGSKGETLLRYIDLFITTCGAHREDRQSENLHISCKSISLLLRSPSFVTSNETGDANCMSYSHLSTQNWLWRRRNVKGATSGLPLFLLGSEYCPVPKYGKLRYMKTHSPPFSRSLSNYFPCALEGLETAYVWDG